MKEKPNYMEFNRYHRNAEFGERVLFYQTGTRDTPPLLGIIVESSEYTVKLVAVGPNSAHRFQKFTCVRHIDDPHWKDHPLQLAKNGGWDFHPVDGPAFNNILNLQKAHQARQQQLEEQKASMSAEEFDQQLAIEQAMEALDIHGAQISKVAAAANLTVDRLKALPGFMDAFKAKKQEEWDKAQDAKNSKSKKSELVTA